MTRGIVKIMLTIKESGVIDMEEKLPRKTEKPWGNELLYALTPQYAGKVISVNKGFRLSLQYHKEKDESMYLLQGKVKFSVQAPDGKMSETIGQPGYCLHLPPLTKHRVEAIEDSIILEVSTPQLSDVVRLQDDFGRAR